MHTILLALHIIGSGIMLGVVLFGFLISFKKVIDPSKLSVLKTILVFGTIGAIWQVVTGLELFFQEPGEFKGSGIFWVKIGLFFLDGVVALLIIDRRIKKAEAEASGNNSINLKNTYLFSLFSLLTIISIIILGVFLTER